MHDVLVDGCVLGNDSFLHPPEGVYSGTNPVPSTSIPVPASNGDAVIDFLHFGGFPMDTTTNVGLTTARDVDPTATGGVTGVQTSIASQVPTSHKVSFQPPGATAPGSAGSGGSGPLYHRSARDLRQQDQQLIRSSEYQQQQFKHIQQTNLKTGKRMGGSAGHAWQSDHPKGEQGPTSDHLSSGTVHEKDDRHVSENTHPQRSHQTVSSSHTGSSGMYNARFPEKTHSQRMQLQRRATSDIYDSHTR